MASRIVLVVLMTRHERLTCSILSAYKKPIDNQGIAATMSREITNAPI
jgi:hypothetical protein